MLKISNKLLSAVVGFTVVKHNVVDNNIVMYDGSVASDTEEWNQSINIYEFENKCAEWALQKGFEVHVSFKWHKTKSKRYVNYPALKDGACN